MKKGFSNFSSINFNSQNSQANESPNDQNNSRNNGNNASQQNPNTNDKKEPQNNGFSSIRKQANNPLSQNQGHVNQTAFQNPSFSLNPPISNGIGNNVMHNGAFGNYPMGGMDNPPYFQNGLNTFNDNPYGMLFNQFQNGSSSLTANQASSEAMIMTLFQIIQSQAKSLQSLYGKVEKMTQKINEFGQKMKEIKKVKRQPNEDDDQKPVIEHIGQSMENIDSKTLIKILFGSNKVYNYRLQLNEPLELPLYRQRNFSISLKLTDQDGKVVKNNNKIPLSLAIYSSENPPKFIEKNTAGQKILKGYIEQSLHHGQCRFEKIQIKEVTSHFRNGWVFIVIIPCMTPLGSANPNDFFIDYLKIQPLVLDKVVVKAKKIKDVSKKTKEEKDQSQMAEVKDSEYGAGSEKVELKQKPQSVSIKPKADSNFEQSEDIFEDK